MTRAADYMLRLLYVLASRPPDEIVRRQDLVAAAEVPDGLIPKLMGPLRRAGFVTITQGPRGGYRLAVRPDQITLLDAVELGMGPMALNECVIRPLTCQRSPRCAIHRALDEASQRMRDSLRAVTFADLLARGACLEDAINGAGAKALPQEHTASI